MTAFEWALLANLVLVALLAGNEVGTWAVIHPALDRLPLAAAVPAEQAIYRRYGFFMPPLVMLSLVSGVVVVSLASGAAFAAALAGLVALAAMQAITFVGNLPLNKRILAAPPDVPESEWRDLRRRWDRFHDARVVLDVAALAGFVLAALLAPSPG